jgi:hypothetical protein
MPASSLTFFIKNRADPGAKEVIRPIYKPGNDFFKMLYGARGIINSNPTLKDMPGVADILKNYNDSTEARHHLAEGAYEKTLQSQLRFLRFLLNGLRYKQLFTYEGASYANNVRTIPDQTRTTLQADARTPVNKVIELTDSTFQKDQRMAIATHVQRIENCEDYSSMSREAILVYNIIDLNKVPINFSALMKEIPMVNLLNYSYTFDRMVMDLLGLTKDDVDALTKGNEPYSITNAKLEAQAGVQGYSGPTDPHHKAARLLGLMLMFPYDEVDKDVYENVLSRVIRGDMGVDGLGRPAYLGDQIYNKALFGELYTGNGLTEAGPITSTGANPAALRYMRVDPKSGRALDLAPVSTDGPAGAQYKPLLQAIGRMRFDTKFVRNLFWITNIQRVLRLRMRRDLYWFDTKIVSEHAVLAPPITEQYDHEAGPLVKRFMH